MDSNKTRCFSPLKPQRRAVFGLLLSSFLTALPGCIPPKSSPQESQAKIVSISEKASACEVQLREKMERKALNLEAPTGYEQLIQSANALIPSADKSEFLVELENNQVRAVATSYIYRKGETENEVIYRVSPPREGSKAALALTVSVRSLQENAYMKVEQVVHMNERCEPTLNSTKLKKIKIKGKNLYAISEEVLYANQEKETFAQDINLPEGGVFLDLKIGIEKPGDMPELGYRFNSKLGILTFQRQPAVKTDLTRFGIKFQLEAVGSQILAGTEKVGWSSFGYDPVMNVKLLADGPAEIWSLPLKLWQEQKLASTKDLNALMSFELPTDYLEKNDSLRLITQKPLAYDHMAAYWKVTKEENGPSGKNSYLLAENAAATIADKATAIDLQSNETIQTDLPEVQLIASDILSQAPDNRQAQVQLLLQYLRTHYKYDTKMLESESIRPLTTQEAIARGSGVCQHYAVIFTAIARAMKIPARIVAGYSLARNKPVLHAWNEVEILPGLWRVVEPQNPQSLSSLKTREYLPIIRGALFEDMQDKKSYLEAIRALSDQSYTIKTP